MDAVAALYAIEAIDRPGAFGAIDAQRPRRTVLRTQRTADALVDIDADVAAHSLWIVSGFFWIVKGHRWRHQVF